MEVGLLLRVWGAAQWYRTCVGGVGSGTAAAAMRLRMMASSARRCTADRMAAGVGGTDGAGAPCKGGRGAS